MLYSHPPYHLRLLCKRTADPPALEQASLHLRSREITTLRLSLHLVVLGSVVAGGLESGRQTHRVLVAVVERVLEHMVYR